jgi:lipoprotein-releasing system permease protein
LTKTLGTQAHMVLSAPDERVTPVLARTASQADFSDVQARAQRLRTVDNWPAVVTAIEQRPGVAAVSPLVAGAALARRGEATRAVSVNGVDLERYERLVSLSSKLVAGTLRLAPGEAIVGHELAAEFGVRVGDRITLSTGERNETVRLSAQVDLGVKELNRRTVIVPLRTAQSLLDLTGGVTQLDVTVNDVWRAKELAQGLARQMPYKVESWQETNAQLVSALNAQGISTLLIRVVVMIVVVLGIASVLVVSVVQKQREIGILRAMGATRAQLMRVFLLQGALVGALGSVSGIGLAVLMISLFTRFVRGSDGLPLFAITLPPALALQVAGLALVSGVLAALAPARRASRMDPAQAIRL